MVNKILLAGSLILSAFCANTSVNTAFASEDSTLAQRMLSPKEQQALNNKLIDAIKQQDVARVRQAIQAGADVNFEAPAFGTPLEIATSADESLDPRVTSDEQLKQHFDIIKLLLDASANPDIRDRDGRTILMNLIIRPTKGYSGCIREMCELLIRGGADINATDNDGRSVLSFALADSRSWTLEMLMNQPHLEIDARYRDDQGRTLLHVIDSFRDGTPQLQKLFDILLAQGVDLDAKDNEGETPLGRAAAEWRLPMVAWLVAHGADLNRPIHPGATLLGYTMNEMQDIEMGRWLIEHGADIEAAPDLSKEDKSELEQYMAASEGAETEFMQYMAELMKE